MITGILPIKGLNVVGYAPELEKSLGTKPIKNVAASYGIQMVTMTGLGGRR